MTKINFINSIKFVDTDSFNSYTFENENIFEPLNKVNLFVGQNNSGKSRFLRQVFITDEFLYKTNNLNGRLLIPLIDDLIVDLDKNVFKDGVEGVGNTSKDTYIWFKEKISDHISIAENIFNMFRELLLKTLESSGTITASIPPHDFSYYHNNLKQIAKKYLDTFDEMDLKKFELNEFNRYYIPIMRGMRPFDEIETNHYQKRTEKDYFYQKIKNNKFRLFTGIELYKSIKGKLLGEPEDREDIKKFEDFLSVNFFNSKTLTLIPRDQADTVFIKIGNEPQLPIFNLGDGLQNLIIITYNIFLEKNSCLFFIEEPDISMHPGLQRTLLEEMIKNNKHQFFITTHSNHLLDLTIDYSEVNVFNFKKEIIDNKISFHVNSKSNYDRNLLIDLGVRNSSVFLVNSTIWVEGITDRLFLRSYLHKYLSDFLDQDKVFISDFYKLKEDIDFSFVEYQGSNLTHWSFWDSKENEKIRASFLTGNPIVIADGDILTKGKRAEEYQGMLQDRFIILECKEIENLIPEKIMQLYLEKKYKDSFNDISLIKFDEYSKPNINLGSYLNSRLKDSTNNIFTERDSKTIKNKLKFCENILEIMNSYGDWILPIQTKNICSKIYHHILKNKF